MAAVEEHNPLGEGEEMEDEEEAAKTKLENVKYYTSLVLGTICIVCIFAFLFLVPFILDPAISTILHEFSDNPVTCRVNSIEMKKGKSNCTWSSCRLGCTSTMFECVQIRIKYSLEPFRNGTYESQVSQWEDLTRFDLLDNMTKDDTPLLINIKGCGYPPGTDCEDFAQKYRNHSEIGLTFPCYYSKVNPWIVLSSYNFNELLGKTIASIAIPNGLFVVSLIVLLYWYCPYCQARCRKYEEQTDELKDEDNEDLRFEEIQK